MSRPDPPPWRMAEQDALIAALGQTDHELSRELLARRIVASLHERGFTITESGLAPPNALDKDALRKMHALSVQTQLQKAAPGLARHEARLLGRLVPGDAVDPERLRVRVVPVTAGSENELLFRWVRLHWSIPTSPGYGRRLRFLIEDEHTGGLVGVIGLGDPVFALGPRDRWVGWDRTRRREALRHVMDAFVVGAVPPFTSLLGGKLVASLLGCDEIVRAFAVAYGERDTVLAGRRGSQLALVTTASALGRSSIYNRVALDGRQLMTSVGETLGSGDFHFAADLYEDMRVYAHAFCTPTAKRQEWGVGFRNRREVVRRVLLDLDLPDKLIYHGVKRELFTYPTGPTSREFLRGEVESPGSWGRTAAEIGWQAQQRWMLRRAANRRSWRTFDPMSWRLWSERSVLPVPNAAD